MTHRQELPGSKWFKYLVMNDSENLHPYLPDTEVYSDENLWFFLEHYPVVFIKPEFGAGGRKVFRVVRDRKRYHIQMEQDARYVRSLSDVHRWVERVRKGKKFIVQEGIDLAYWSGRPVDIRTIVQINERDRWEVTGMFCKMAGRDLAVTNVCIGGSAYPVERYLKALGYHRRERARMVAQLKEMSLAVVKPFADAYRNSIYGLDIGLDTSGNLFLIELNTIPRIGIFREMKLDDMYRRARKLFLVNNTSVRKEYLCRLPIVQQEPQEQEPEVDVADEVIEAVEAIESVAAIEPVEVMVAEVIESVEVMAAEVIESVEVMVAEAANREQEVVEVTAQTSEPAEEGIIEPVQTLQEDVGAVQETHTKE